MVRFAVLNPAYEGFTKEPFTNGSTNTRILTAIRGIAGRIFLWMADAELIFKPDFFDSNIKPS